MVRVFVSDTAELDESEQVLLAQQWQWGYGLQPPLYTWIQARFFAVFGQNIFALSFLKHLLLFGTFAFTYWTATEISDDGATPLLAMLSLLLVPQFAWESHRDLTHSVAATTCGTATLLALVRLLKRPTAPAYLLVGALAGLGLLAKYNFGIFLLAALAAALSIRDFRRVLTQWPVIGAVAAFAIITAGHFTWIAHTGVTPGRHDVLRSVWQALGLWTKAVLAFGALLLPLFLWIRFRTSPGKDGTRSRFETLLFRTLVAATAISLIVVLTWKGRFKDRWFQPVLFALPLYFALWARPRLSPGFLRTLIGLTITIAVGSLLALTLIPPAARITGRPTRLNLPYAELASQLRARGIAPGIVIADSRLTGGNFQLHFPQAKVLVPELSTGAPAPGDCLIIWDATKRSEAPRALTQLVRKLGYSVDLSQSERIESPLKYLPPETMQVSFVVIPAK